MRKVLHFLKCVLLLAFLVFLVMCTHSVFMSGTTDIVSPDSPVPVSKPVFTQSPQKGEVVLSSGSYPEDISELTAVVIPADFEQIERFTALRSADFSGSSCYSEIVSWAEVHPDISVRYTVSLPDGQTAENTAESLDLSDMAPSDAGKAAELLQYLPNMKKIELGVVAGDSPISAEDLAALQVACPNAVLNYKLTLLGQNITLADEELDFSSITKNDVSAVSSVMSSMSNLRTVHLGGEQNGLSWDDVTMLHNAAPEAVLDYTFSMLGVSANLSDTDLSFSHIKMDDQGAAVRKLVPLMVKLETLDMDSCGVSNESMAVIRDENPSVNVIWRVNFAGYTARTDVERILASTRAKGGAVTDAEAQVLKYCTKVKYLDLGHNEVLTDISFAAYMPELEVAIFAINDIDDISALANCPKLEYLEINSTNVTDLTPLANATALRHLNIGRTGQTAENTFGDKDRPRVTDISPLFGLSDLKRLYIGSLTSAGIPKEQLDKMGQVMKTEKKDSDGNYCDPKVSPEGLPYDYIRINISDNDPSQGTWRVAGYRPNWVWEQYAATGVFNDPLNERYKLLREQFGYDNVPYSYSLPSNDPLY